LGGSGRLHNEELHNMYTSPNITRVIKSREMKWVGHVACMEEMRNAYIILVGRPEGKKPLGRSKSRWEYMLECILGKYGG
jgi:hypothetical protein